MIKQDFGLEKYLEAISDSRYRIATSKLCASLHTLEIERGRYTKPKSDISKRFCPVCCTIEDEVHFLINCKSYEPERQRLFLIINEKKQNFQRLNDVEKFTHLLSNPGSVNSFINIFKPSPSLFSNKGVMYIKYTCSCLLHPCIGYISHVPCINPPLPWNRSVGSVVAGGAGGYHTDSSRRPRRWRGW